MTKKSQKQETPVPDEKDSETGAASEIVDSDTQAGVEESGDALQKQLDDLNGKYVRLYSDFDNFRKRTIKERADLIGSASESVIKDLLGVIDDFERAIENNEKTDKLENIREGVRLVHQKMLSIMTAKGLEKMEAKGEVFDAEKHEAITSIDAGKEMKGKVVDVIESGFKLNGKPIRYAKVVVGL